MNVEPTPAKTCATRSRIAHVEHRGSARSPGGFHKPACLCELISCTLNSAGPAIILDIFSTPSPRYLDISRHSAGRSAGSDLARNVSFASNCKPKRSELLCRQGSMSSLVPGNSNATRTKVGIL